MRLRNSIVPATFIGKKFRVYNGAYYLIQYITKSMVGFKLGEFAYTKMCRADMHSLARKARKKERLKKLKKLENQKKKSGSCK